MHSGIARACYLMGDESTDQAPREITGWLSFPEDLAGCLTSMITGQPAGETIELVGNGQLTALRYPRMQQAAADHPALLKLSLRLVEWSYLRLEQRLVAL